MEYAPHQQRVVDEKEELDARRQKLNDFLQNNPIFASLPAADQDLLRQQHEAMTGYSDILGQRIARFTN